MNQTLRDQVRQRANGICEYCQLPEEFDVLTFEVEHIIARKHAGMTSSENLALACYQCNSYKGPNIAGLDPRSGQVVRLFHPRQDQWGNHFEWKGARLIGKTPEGRATIEVLRINLPLRIVFRQSLIDEGVFPPCVK